MKQYFVIPFLWLITLPLSGIVGYSMPLYMGIPLVIWVLFKIPDLILDTVANKNTFAWTRIFALLHVVVMLVGVYMGIQYMTVTYPIK